MKKVLNFKNKILFIAFLIMIITIINVFNSTSVYGFITSNEVDKSKVGTSGVGYDSDGTYYYYYYNSDGRRIYVKYVKGSDGKWSLDLSSDSDRMEFNKETSNAGVSSSSIKNNLTDKEMKKTAKKLSNPVQQIEDPTSSSSSSSSAYSSTSDPQSKTYSSGEDMAQDIFNSGKNFINEGSAESTINKKDIQDKLLPIANVIVYIATGVFLVVGSILGVRYMLAQDMQERAQIQKNLLWFVIAMAIVYGGVGIYNIVVRILNGLF